MKVRFINKNHILDIEPTFYKDLKIINLGASEIYDAYEDGKFERVFIKGANFPTAPTASQSDRFQTFDDFDLPVPSPINGYIFILPNYYVKNFLLKERKDCFTIIGNKLYLL